MFGLLGGREGLSQQLEDIRSDGDELLSADGDIVKQLQQMAAVREVLDIGKLGFQGAGDQGADGVGEGVQSLNGSDGVNPQRQTADERPAVNDIAVVGLVLALHFKLGVDQNGGTKDQRKLSHAGVADTVGHVTVEAEKFCDAIFEEAEAT